MKYVMLRRKYTDGLIQDIPIIFPNMLVHADVAIAIRDVMYKYWPDIEIVRAGEYNISSSETSGSSESLELTSAIKDGDLILGHDYFHGLSEG